MTTTTNDDGRAPDGSSKHNSVLQNRKILSRSTGHGLHSRAVHTGHVIVVARPTAYTETGTISWNGNTTRSERATSDTLLRGTGGGDDYLVRVFENV
ncbi:hypothetical protein WN55_08382 [Dufourea novaeangliae]|uniref:Uncharacterized protein n=1 Tax=Dufourea novaeangliae TaxID=178035 RepID=A0A154P8Y0_DUFNO|nr:hypothetical protein WN55_08382 [Dufourea novaeangliae]